MRISRTRVKRQVKMEGEHGRGQRSSQTQGQEGGAWMGPISCRQSALPSPLAGSPALWTLHSEPFHAHRCVLCIMRFSQKCENPEREESPGRLLPLALSTCPGIPSLRLGDPCLQCGWGHPLQQSRGFFQHHLLPKVFGEGQFVETELLGNRFLCQQ